MSESKVAIRVLKDALRKAIARLERNTPCAHENADTKLGDGQTWAKCEDCAATFAQDRWPEIRARVLSYEKFCEDLKTALDEPKEEASPYDLFLTKNNLPRQPNAGESDLDYSRRLRAAVNALTAPVFVTPGDGGFTTHSIPFAFGPNELAGLVLFLAEPQSAPQVPPGGYHVAPIPRGTFGEFSKIEEEFNELKDAIQQENKVMALVEMSDMLGAIEGYLQAQFDDKMTLDDLKTMAQTTKRAFKSGARK